MDEILVVSEDVALNWKDRGEEVCKIARGIGP